MPRKSSFLMGFESGASIYDSAKRRQMAAKQLQLQTRQQTLAEDAAEQRRGLLDMQIKQAQQKMDEFKRKADERVTSYNTINTIQETISMMNPGKDPKWWSKPENYRLAQGIWAELEDGITDTGALARWDVYKETIGEKEGAKKIKLIEAQNLYEMQFNAEMKLRDGAQKSKDIKKFNFENKTSLPITSWNEIATLNRKKAGILRQASATGTYTMDEDWPAGMHESVTAEAQVEIDIFKGKRTIKVEDAASAAALASIKLIEQMEQKSKQEQKNAFNKWKQLKGREHLIHDTPSGMKVYRTSLQREALIENIDWEKVGAHGLTLLGTLEELPQGGYSQMTVARLHSNLAALESGETRRRIPKTEAAAKGVLYSEIMLFNGTIMDQIEQQGTPGTAKFWDSYIQEGKLSKLGNYALDANVQQYKNAADNFIAAVLRKESGAAITEQERKDYWPQYIPVPGDKPEVVTQKNLARKMFMEATRNITGLRWEDTAESRVSPPPIPFTSSAAAQDALNLGKLKEGDTYSFYDNNGNLMRGTVVAPGAPKKEKGQPIPKAEPTQPMQQVEVAPTMPSITPGEAPLGVDASGDPIVPAGGAPAQPAPAEPSGYTEGELQSMDEEAQSPPEWRPPSAPEPEVGIELDQDALMKKLPPLPPDLPPLPGPGTKPGPSAPAPKKGAGKKVEATRAQDARSLADYLVDKFGADPEEAQVDSDKILEAINNPDKYPKEYIEKAKRHLDEAKKKFPRGK